MLYLYYMAAFGGLPYINTTPQGFLYWFVIIAAIASVGFCNCILLAYQSQIAKFWLIALIATNIISLGISVFGVIVIISFIFGFHK